MARAQQTIEHVSEIHGFGLFTNADVKVRFLPAEEHHGIVFERVDLPESPRIPATVAYLTSEDRRTKLTAGHASVEMTEHLLAAFAGLQIDNCLVQINAPELPGCDGSALPYAEALLQAGVVTQLASRQQACITESLQFEDNGICLRAEPCPNELRISYELNYNGAAPIPAQLAEFRITPEIFLEKIAPARTFVLEKEIAFLRSKGYGKKVTYQDLLVFDDNGPVENVMRFHNECARHKLLDCLGDLALCGCDVTGHVRAFRSGHRHNHLLAKYLFSSGQETESLELQTCQSR